jgi:serine/threonine protein kinase
VALRAGDYELVRRLVRGGMGDVWLARHVTLDRPAAVKLLRLSAVPGSRKDRAAAGRALLGEARLLASLRSPHTVRVHDAGRTWWGVVFYAMEFLEGVDAGDFVYRFGTIEPRRAVRWLQSACDPIAELHTRGLVHGDLRPTNLFICRHGHDDDFVKVLDFGLSRSEPDARADVHALGQIAFWLMTGKLPFEIEPDAAPDGPRLHAVAPPLSSLAPEDIPARLEEIIMGCLSPRPEERPADAGMLYDLLADCSGLPPWTDDDGRNWWRVHRDDP